MNRRARAALALAGCLTVALVILGAAVLAPFPSMAAPPAVHAHPSGADPSQTFTSSGTFTDPTGVTSVSVTVIGGGAGGGGGGCGIDPSPHNVPPGPSGSIGNVGHVSTFDGVTGAAGNPGLGGAGSNDSNVAGGAGGAAPTGGHAGGAGAGSPGSQYTEATGGSGGAGVDGGYGGGGSGGTGGAYYAGAGGGGSSGGVVSTTVTLVPGDGYTVTVGAGGTGGTGGSGSPCTGNGDPYSIGGAGAAGTSGAVLLSWTTVPPAPTGFAVTAEPATTSITVGWTNPSGTLTGDTVGYATYVSSCGSYTTAAISTATTYTFAGLTSGNFYCLEVSASNATGAGPYTSLSDILAGRPAAPTGVTLSSETHNSATLSWTNANLGTFSLHNVTGFVAVYSGSSCGTYGAGISLGTVSTYTFGSLTGGDSYCFELKDWTPYWAGTAATDSGVAIPSGTYPVAPKNLAVSAEALTTSVSVTWTQPPGTLTGNEVGVANDNTGSCGSFTDSAISTATAHTFASLTSGSYYCFEVAGVNSTGIGAYAILAYVPAGHPPAPNGLTITAQTATTITLHWTNPGLGPLTLANVTGFVARYSGTSCLAYTASSLGAVASTTFTGLSPGHGYCLYVKAWSPYWASSAPSSVIGDTAPAAPTGVGGAITLYGPYNLTVSFTVTWAAPLTTVTNETVKISETGCASFVAAFSAGNGLSFVVERLPLLVSVTSVCFEVIAWNGTLYSMPSASYTLSLPQDFFPAGSGSPYLGPLIGIAALVAVIFTCGLFLKYRVTHGSGRHRYPRRNRKGRDRS